MSYYICLTAELPIYNIIIILATTYNDIVLSVQIRFVLANPL